MADVTPNYDLERQRMELERSQLLLNVLSQNFRIAQMEDEKARIKMNIEATQKAVAELEKTIAALPGEKGVNYG